MKGRNYRLPRSMPYTRKEFIRGSPQLKIAKFSTGASSKDYEVKLELRVKGKVQIRHNAIEAARVAANKKLADVGEERYFLSVRVYPHIILKENKMIATAGADRLQEGMRRAFGKPIGLAARVKADQTILEVRVFKSDLAAAKGALKTAASKFPVTSYVNETPLQPIVAEGKNE